MIEALEAIGLILAILAITDLLRLGKSRIAAYVLSKLK